MLSVSSPIWLAIPSARDSGFPYAVIALRVSGLVIDCVVERGNPTDSTKAVTLARHVLD